MRMSKKNRVTASRNSMTGLRYVKANNEIFDNEQIRYGKELKDDMIKGCQELENIFYKLKIALILIDDDAFIESGFDSEGEELANPAVTKEDGLEDIHEFIEKVKDIVFIKEGYDEIIVSRITDYINTLFYGWLNKIKSGEI